MKVLHVNGHLSGGGVEQYLSQLFPLLRAQKIENVLIHGEAGLQTPPPESLPLYHIEGITRIFCPNLRDKLRQVEQIIDHERPDIAYIHQSASVPLLRLLISRLPTVRFVHDFKLICPDGKKTLNPSGDACFFPLGFRCQVNAYRYRCMPRNPFVGVPLIRNCLTMTSMHRKESPMVVASHFMKDVLIYNGFPGEKIHVIPYFTHLPALDSSPMVNDPIQILALGRITKDKGFACLLRAYGSMRAKARITLVGDGPDLGNLKSLAGQLGISSQVEFTGWLPHEALDRLYRQCSLVIVPSLWPEPFGIVGIEAMAYRKLVIAFDVGGISEWLEDGKTGYCIRRGDIETLAAKMNYILDHKEIAVTFGQAGRASVEKRFTADSHCESLERLFHSTIRNHNT